MTRPSFQQLNTDWNAEPNVPKPGVEVVGRDLRLHFYLNPFQYPKFKRNDVGIVRFRMCARYRLGETNDEGWYRGQCRYSKAAPAWGDFYEIIGPDSVADQPNDWIHVSNEASVRHFIFYFRDETFECFAADWQIERCDGNALSG